MPSRNVALRMEAYRALDVERRAGESFSDAVLRLTRAKPKLSEVLASMEPIDPATADEYGREMAKVRAQLEREWRRRLR